MKQFYVYSLTDPRDLSVFYVGKGQNSRRVQHTHKVVCPENDTSKKAERIRKILGDNEEVISTILKRFDSEEEAYKYEAGIISKQTGLLNEVAGGAGGRSKRVSTKAKVEKLTVKQEMFCLKYIETGNASEAYRYAYEVNKTCKAETVHRSAKEVLDNPKIATRLEELHSRHQRKNDVTVDKLSGMYQTAYELAEQTSQPNAMNGSTTGLGKLHGLLTDKAQVEVNLAVGFADRLNQLKAVN